jgi:1-acyl-sn-glycerol-3-phosphate acyltransferase/long-chain acyl-CoA synthetase|tara:strand:+ start:1232 stop:1960 length:729 start_codon:yes stop_codon:yes gene_type:complete
VASFQELLEQTTLEPEYAYLRADPRGRLACWHKAFELFCRGLFNLYCPLKVIGRENLPSPPFMFCSNHCSHMDSAALMYAGGEDFNQYGMVAAKDYFFDNQKRNSFLSKLMNLIPADRGARRTSIVKLMVACREFTRHGNRSLIIYPEGTRSKTGEMVPMKKGPAMIAATLDIPIVPVYIKGTHHAYPKGGRIIKPARICVRIGEPIDPNRFQEEHGGDRTIYTAITSEMENRIHKLKDIHG